MKRPTYSILLALSWVGAAAILFGLMVLMIGLAVNDFGMAWLGGYFIMVGMCVIPVIIKWFSK